MTTDVLFEHPLNEKMRTWLRIEFLTQQLSGAQTIADHAGALHFFRNAATCSTCSSAVKSVASC